MPDANANAPMIGSSVAVVAVLLVSSVRKTTSVTKINIINMRSKVPIVASAVPMKTARPDDLTADAKLKPPPNSNNTPHGIVSAVFQSSNVEFLPSFDPEGIINISIAPATDIRASLSHGSMSRFFWIGVRRIHEAATKANSIVILFSGSVIGPISSNSCCNKS